MKYTLMLVRALLVCLILTGTAFGQTSNAGPTVRFHTTLGDIDVQLTPSAAPATVANFLNYLNKGAYTNTIFHRSVARFVIQAGGYALVNHKADAIPADAPVKNEFNVSNKRGTIAMAKTDGDPNSATNQWFFNIRDANAANLDFNNGGFTVFGKITNQAGLDVMDAINTLQIYDAGSPFDTIPLLNFQAGGTPQDANFVLVTSIEALPFVTEAGIASAASFAPATRNGIAPGEILTIFGTAIGPTQLTTLVVENGVVTTSLGGTRVLFDGVPAPLIYTSAGQLSVVAPLALAGKFTTRVAVEYQGVITGAIPLPVADSNPGIFTLSATGVGDAAIVRPSGDVISATNPAAVGEVLLLYGEGYGAATNAPGDGAIVGASLPVPVVPVRLFIDNQEVPTQYAGGAPSLINGVLQVNFAVPALAPGSHEIQLQVGDRTSPAGVKLQTK